MAYGVSAPNAAIKAEGYDLALVLAVDVSRSMDLQEQQLQRDGYVRAFRDPEIIKAIQGGSLGRIAVTYVEWSGAFSQSILAPWTEIDGPASAYAFADVLSKAPVGTMNSTSISGALAFAARAFPALGEEATRQVIDISGDGPNNEGPPVVTQRDKTIAQGITINGLPVMLTRTFDASSIPDLDLYYKNCVIGGPTAFMLSIKRLDEFATATRRKLILEISNAIPEASPSDPFIRVATQDYDCMVGERRRLFQP